MSRSPFALIIALVLALTCASAVAQNQGKTTKVVLYKDRIAAQWDTVKCVKNVLKMNPLLFLKGEMPLYYERALSHNLSAELALGVTFRNYLGGAFSNEEPDDFSAGTHIIAKPSYHVGFRYYFTDDVEPQGIYMQGEFAYLDYSKDISKKDSTGRYTDETLRDQRLYNDVRLYLGYQRLSSTNNWLFDVYCGIGLRNRSLTEVEERLDLVERSWSYTVTETHDNVPVGFLGVKIGYGF